MWVGSAAVKLRAGNHHPWRFCTLFISLLGAFLGLRGFADRVYGREDERQGASLQGRRSPQNLALISVNGRFFPPLSFWVLWPEWNCCGVGGSGLNAPFHDLHKTLEERTATWPIGLD